MNIVEEHCWDALANLLPALGRDFEIEISSPEAADNAYKCSVVLKYMTDAGAAIIPVIAEKLNGEMIKILTSQLKDDRLKQITMASLAQSKVADVQIVDGRSAPVETQENTAPENLPAKTVKIEQPKTISEPSTSNQEHENEDLSVLEFHWASVFKSYLPSPDIESFYAWIRRLLTIELNRRLFADKRPVYQLPDEFDKDWMENVSMISAQPVITAYSAIVNPSGFKEIVDTAYENLKDSLDRAMMYNGTLKVGLSPLPTNYLDSINAARIDIVYMGKKQNNQIKGE